jgi:hypothetical protein
MAYTEIHPITTTPERAVGYVLADKVEKIESEDEVHTDVPHEVFMRNEQMYVRYQTIASFERVSMKQPMDSFNQLRLNGQNKHQQGGSRAKEGKEPVLYHMTQNFNGREVPRDIANEIAMKTCTEVFPNFAFLVTTHTNTNNIHNHIIISAWGDDGKKLNNDHALVRRIRKVSDRLCKEYGLSTLEKTKDMKLIKYKDKDGVTRFYEPTDRKNELIDKRKAQEISTDDVNSYRNTLPYEREQYAKKSNQELIKMDIDGFLPICSSYDELLERLREIGYTINAKKKNGEWLSHVSFQPPTADKASRENKIGNGTFYLRENLTAFIEKQAKNQEREQTQESEPDKLPSVPYFDHYVYGETDLTSINLDYRNARQKDGTFAVVPRTEGEKKVIVSVRANDARVKDIMDMAALSNMIALQLNEKRNRRPYFKRTEEQRLVAQINESLDCLTFTEKQGLFSYEQFFVSCQNYQRIFNEDIAKRTTIVATIAKLRDATTLPEKVQKLELRIAEHKGDTAYIFDERRFDEAELKKYKDLMRSYKIETPEQQKKLKDTVCDFESRLQKVDKIIAEVQEQLRQIDNCVRTYDRIDIAAGNQNVAFIRKYEAMKRGEEVQEQNEEKNNERERGIEKE